jgi:hypothetical protein
VVCGLGDASASLVRCVTRVCLVLGVDHLISTHPGDSAGDTGCHLEGAKGWHRCHPLSPPVPATPLYTQVYKTTTPSTAPVPPLVKDVPTPSQLCAHTCAEGHSLLACQQHPTTQLAAGYDPSSRPTDSALVVGCVSPQQQVWRCYTGGPGALSHPPLDTPKMAATRRPTCPARPPGPKTAPPTPQGVPRKGLDPRHTKLAGKRPQCRRDMHVHGGHGRYGTQPPAPSPHTPTHPHNTPKTPLIPSPPVKTEHLPYVAVGYH